MYILHLVLISNLFLFTSMHPKSNKKTIAINTGLLAYTFSKLGDNPTNNEGDNTNCKIQLNYVKYIALSANVPSGLKIENLRSSERSRETTLSVLREEKVATICGKPNQKQNALNISVFISQRQDGFFIFYEPHFRCDPFLVNFLQHIVVCLRTSPSPSQCLTCSGSGRVTENDDGQQPGTASGRV